MIPSATPEDLTDRQVPQRVKRSPIVDSSIAHRWNRTFQLSPASEVRESCRSLVQARHNTVPRDCVTLDQKPQTAATSPHCLYPDLLHRTFCQIPTTLCCSNYWPSNCAAHQRLSSVGVSVVTSTRTVRIPANEGRSVGVQCKHYPSPLELQCRCLMLSRGRLSMLCLSTLRTTSEHVSDIVSPYRLINTIPCSFVSRVMIHPIRRLRETDGLFLLAMTKQRLITATEGATE